MNKKFAWELFKNTGNIDAYMLMKDVELGEELMQNNKIVGESNGDNKNQGNSYENC